MRVESEPQQPIGPRPTGFVRPAHKRARQALEALEGGYIRTAEAHIEAMSDLWALENVWLLYLRGLLAAERGEFSAAEPLLMQTASQAPTADAGSMPTPSALRLAARALEKVGWILRRRDRPNEAYQIHLSAYHIRNEHGSFEEIWETATSLGLDSHLARRETDCQSWHRMAIEAARQASEEPEHKQAVSWSNLSSSLTKSGSHEEAVDAARTARQFWHKYDVSAVTAARADLHLGHALLKQGEHLVEAQDAAAGATLDESIEWLTCSHEALSAFGKDAAADLLWCEEQRDFALRLRSTLDI